MALVLSGERPADAAASNPLRIIGTWFAKVQAARAQRRALVNLLALDNHRLADIGINRGDLFDAVHANHRPTLLLQQRRGARHSSGASRA
jgi:uncharacterized protein YjiS (DUF1127 family)